MWRKCVVNTHASCICSTVHCGCIMRLPMLGCKDYRVMHFRSRVYACKTADIKVYNCLTGAYSHFGQPKVKYRKIILMFLYQPFHHKIFSNKWQNFHLISFMWYPWLIFSCVLILSRIANILQSLTEQPYAIS